MKKILVGCALICSLSMQASEIDEKACSSAKGMFQGAENTQAEIQQKIRVFEKEFIFAKEHREKLNALRESLKPKIFEFDDQKKLLEFYSQAAKTQVERLQGKLVILSLTAENAALKAENAKLKSMIGAKKVLKTDKVVKIASTLD